MHHDAQHPALRYPRVLCALVLSVILVTGCRNEKPKETAPRYPSLGLRQVPKFLEGTIYQYCNLENTEPYPISGYGLMFLPNGGGDNTYVPTPVRDYMIKEMVKRGFGSKLREEYANMKPENLLRDPRYAIVRVDGFIPPGARKDSQMDVQVSALEGTATRSLAGGRLYRAELKVNGAYALAPGFQPKVSGWAEGNVFVNPTYRVQAATTNPTSGANSLRFGWVMNGGLVNEDRSLFLRVRVPQRSLARTIQFRVDQRFANLKSYSTDKIASARDEGLVDVLVPEQYAGDWERFAEVVKHLYIDPTPAVTQVRAKMLADEAVKPGAFLRDISFCWEGLGSDALPFIQPLMSNANPDVAFAAARAAAFIGDPTAQEALADMARTPHHMFRIDAVQVLGQLPNTPAINQSLRTLLNAEENTVRIEAYRVLAKNGDKSIYSQVIGDNKFILDIVYCDAPPLIYASRRGIPRIAVIGNKPQLKLPITFLTMDDRFSISSNPGDKSVTMYYRPMQVTPRDPVPPAIRVLSHPDAAEIIARLGGRGAEDEKAFRFSYGDIVAIMQAIADGGKFAAPRGEEMAAVPFMLQDIQGFENTIYSAPVIPDQTRPQSENPTQVGVVIPDNTKDQPVLPDFKAPVQK
jgi:flagellar basal body P-ring protein FlgI